jgi:hypothetical protein
MRTRSTQFTYYLLFPRTLQGLALMEFLAITAPAPCRHLRHSDQTVRYADQYRLANRNTQREANANRLSADHLRASLRQFSLAFNEPAMS